MSKKCNVISVSNQKGGVGKTTTAINLASYLANENHQVLLIDLDPQSNASSGLGIDSNAIEGSLYDALNKGATIVESIYPSTIDSLHVLPATQDLAAMEVELVEYVSRETQLRDLIKPLHDIYDYIVIDCPPSLSLLTVNGLTASDYVVIPVQCEFFALEGLSHLVQTLESIRLHLNPNLEIAGILLTMFDSRTTLSREVVDSARRFFKKLVFQTIVPRNIRLTEAPSHGIPIMMYNPSCAGAEAYFELTQEVIDRVS